MDRHSEKTLVFAGLVSFLALIVDGILGQVTHLATVAALLPYVALAFGICLVILARERLARLAEEEQRDFTLARQEKTDTTIFETDDGKFEPFTIGRSRDQFERYVIPAVAPLLAVAEAYWAWRLWAHRGNWDAIPSQRLMAAAFLAAQSFFLFLSSRYLLGLSRGNPYRSLRGPGVAVGMACLGSVLATVSALAGEAGYPVADRLAAWVLTGFLAVLAVEHVANFIGECYRPRRVQGKNYAYESRLGGLVTEPGTWARTVAQALDYQFGFKVSETWLYRFLEGALLPLLIFQVVVFYLLSSLVFLGPDEEGILERFGRPIPAGWHLESGFHLKWPWPFETVRRFPAKRIQTLKLGHAHEAMEGGHGAEMEPSIITWTVRHAEAEEQFLVASARAPTADGPEDTSVPVNLLSFRVPVEYQITNIFQYAYNHVDPTKVVEQIAYRSLTLESASHGLAHILGEGQLQTARNIQRRIQEQADRLGLGIQVVFVGLQEAHPPVAIADAFESVISATEEKEAAILVARGDAVKAVTLAEADGIRLGDEAVAYQVGRTANSKAEADRFRIRLETQAKSPRVFRANLYLDALQNALAGARKYIIAATPPSEVVQFNFEEKLRPELFDLGPAPAEKRK